MISVAPRALRFREQAAEQHHAGGIDARDRLVEEQVARLAEQRLREAEPLEHAARVLADRHASRPRARARRARVPCAASVARRAGSRPASAWW
jgi:hypothetical protein